MDIFLDNNAQISPCIRAKVRYILGLTQRLPANLKRCSPNYLNRVFKTLCHNHKLAGDTIAQATIHYNQIFNNF